MICDEAIVPHVDMTKWSQIILFDAPSISTCTSLLPRCLASATIVFLLESEVFAVPLLRQRGIPFTTTPEALLPLSYMHNETSPPPSLNMVRTWCTMQTEHH
jgi:hypothetical protein